MVKSFYELNIWNKGHELLMEIYKISSSFPEAEKFALTKQMRESSNSVIANIAEAQGRYYHADRKRVLYISRGEVEETRSHLRVANSLKYVDDETFKRLDEEYEGLPKGISVYIKTQKS